MANEAVIIELHGNMGDSMRFTCADAVGIEKGTLLWYYDPRTISGASITLPNYKPFAGIAGEEKVASDGQTSIGVWTSGIFDVVCGSTCVAGDLVVMSGQNMVTRCPTLVSVSGGCIVGRALEDASAGETIAVKLGGFY